MTDLAHERTTMTMDFGGELLEQWDYRIGAHVNLTRGPERICCYRCGSTEHRQCQTATSLFFVIGLVFVPSQAILVQPTRMAGAHDAIFQSQVFEIKRL